MLDLHFPMSSGVLTRILQLRLHAIDFVGQVTRAESPMAKRVGSLESNACAAHINYLDLLYDQECIIHMHV